MPIDWPSLFQPLINLLALVALGWLVGRLGRHSEELTRGLVYILMRLTLPALIVVSMQRPFSQELLWQSAEALVWSLGFYFVIAGIFTVLRPVLPVPKNRQDLIQFVTLFGNVGFMGFPVMEALFGRESLFLASVFNLPFNFIIFTYGVILLRRSGRNQDSEPLAWREVFFTPIMISLVLAFGLFVGNIRLPQPVLGFLDLLGGITTPLSMITVGIMLARVSVRRSLVRPYLWWMAAGRLLVAPALVILFGLFLPASSETLWTAALLTAMPAAANTPILAAEHGGPHEEASQVVLLTSLLVFLTLPILILLMGAIFQMPDFR